MNKVPINLSRLFRPKRLGAKLIPYKDEAAMLSAVERGKKALWRTSVDLSAVSAYDEGLARLFKSAIRRQLAVVLCDSTLQTSGEADLFVLPLEQAWRISALRALEMTAFLESNWTLAAEDQQSLLLGYTNTERRAWLKEQKRLRPAYGCNTVYTLLTYEQRMLIETLGKRSLGSVKDVNGMTFFFHRDYDDIKKSAVRLIPRSITLARVGLEWNASEALFGPWKTMKSHGVVQGTITKRLVAVVNAGLTSHIQFLTRWGWR